MKVPGPTLNLLANVIELGMWAFFNACLCALSDGWGRRGGVNWPTVDYKVHACKEIEK